MSRSRAASPPNGMRDRPSTCSQPSSRVRSIAGSRSGRSDELDREHAVGVAHDREVGRRRVRHRMAEVPRNTRARLATEQALDPRGRTGTAARRRGRARPVRTVPARRARRAPRPGPRPRPRRARCRPRIRGLRSPASPARPSRPRARRRTRSPTRCARARGPVMQSRRGARVAPSRSASWSSERSKSMSARSLACRQTLIHVARAHGDQLVVRVERAGREQLASVEALRPRRTRRAACRSRAAGSIRAAMRPSTYGTSSGRSPLMYMTKLLGQSSAAHRRCGRNQPVGAGEIERVLDRRGEQFARRRRGPGCTRNPSPGTRSGPQTKQPGNGMPLGMHDDGRCGRRGACRCERTAAPGPRRRRSPARPRRSSHRRRGRTSMSPAAASTVSGVSSGDGSRNVTSAGPSKCAASNPAVTPPFPRSGGPANRAGSRPSRRPSGDDDRCEALGALGCGAPVGSPASVD